MFLISIVIPTCNRNDKLKVCLNQLVPSIQQLDPDDYEVIVSDDSKENKAHEELGQEFPNVVWLEGPQKGPAANRNNGVEHAQGEWIIFTDDDCIPSENWLSTYKKNIQIGGFKVYEGLTTAEKKQDRFDLEAPINTTGGNLWSCNFAIEKKLFLSLGGFDEKFPFPAMEDTEMCTRVKANATIKFVPDAKIIHPWRKMVPFKSYRKWLASNKYYLEKLNIPIDSQYRFKRFKLFLGSGFYMTKQLISYSGKGIGFYLEKNWFNLKMIFLKP